MADNIGQVINALVRKIERVETNVDWIKKSTSLCGVALDQRSNFRSAQGFKSLITLNILIKSIAGDQQQARAL